MSLDVLIGCEFSGTVREAFRALGHNAYSCDLLPDDNESVYHVQRDIIGLLREVQWDIAVLHPPCTALAVSGNRHYGNGMPKHQERLDAVQWTQELWETALEHINHVALENPVGVLPRLSSLPKPTYIQPYKFGHKEQKKTGLFLHNLPPLETTDDVYEEMMKLTIQERQRIHYLPPSKDRWKIRSTTYTGVAQAMALQWSTYVEENAND
jgi:hypothetical protein